MNFVKSDKILYVMSKIGSPFKLEGVLEKAYTGRCLSSEEIVFLLSLKEREEVDRLFNVARSLRQRYFGDHIFLYGFVYFSTYCRNSCNFCYYRKPNKLCKRYRKTDDEVIEAVSYTHLTLPTN